MVDLKKYVQSGGTKKMKKSLLILGALAAMSMIFMGCPNSSTSDPTNTTGDGTKTAEGVITDGVLPADWSSGKLVTVAFPDGFAAGSNQSVTLKSTMGTDAGYMCILYIDPDNNWAKWQATNGLKYYNLDGTEISLAEDALLNANEFVIKPTAEQIADFNGELNIQGYNVTVNSVTFSWTE